MPRKSLKSYFIPHEENEYKPHFLRREIVGWLLFGALVIEFVFLVQAYIVLPYTNLLATIFPNVVVDLTNENRVAQNESILLVSPTLQEAAQLKANDMAEKGYFAHVSPDGVNPWHWFQEAGYSYRAAGENLAVNYVDSSDVVSAWMDSPTHRENILNGKFTEIGIATARGTYKGRDAVFVVQLFGTPYIPPKPSPPVQTAGTTPQPIATAPPLEITTTTEPQLAQSGVEGTEMFLETVIPVVSSRVPVAQAAESAPVKVSLFERALTMPRTLTALLFVALIILVSFALVLKISIHITVQHPALIINGAAVIIFLAGFVFANYYFIDLTARIF